MTKWFFRETNFVNYFFSQTVLFYFYQEKYFLYVVHTSHQVSYQRFFIVEIIVEGVNLIQISK